ncbi:MAG: chloride channel protein [Methylococcales bacterium]|nr:chloride channel protein [Methylococcales bacterium]MBT7410430.1 chloride channel protein [Methylococcales bacterium]
MRAHLKKSKRRMFSIQAWKVRLVFWIGALLVGLVAALFAIASDHANHLFLEFVKISPYLPLIICPAGLMIIVWITRNFLPGTEGSGIPQVIASLESSGHNFRKSLLSIKIAIGKIFLTLLGMLSGASIGREGPTVHIGAAIMYSLGHFAKFPAHYMEKGLMLAGGAAGVAAAFNTPLAGIVFALEEMSRSFEERTSGIILTAVIFSGVTAMAVLGNYDYFGSSSSSLEIGKDWIAVPICGIAGGLLGGFFSLCLIWSSKNLIQWAKAFPIRTAAICGFSIALIGILSGDQTYGTGYEQAKGLISGEEEINTAFPLLKLLATLFSYLSGIPGGIFAPSLATGAGLGANLSLIFSDIPVSTLVVLGMAAYFAGVVQAPITAFVIVMEMTNNQNMLLALMTTTFIAYGVSKVICPEPLYRTLANNFIINHKDRNQ